MADRTAGHLVEQPTLSLPIGRPSTPRRRFTGSLTARAVLATCLAALISVLVTALVALPLGVRAANREARAALTEEANLVTAVLDARPAPAAWVRLAGQARGKGVSIWLIRGGRVDRTGMPARFVSAVADGQRVAGGTALINGRLMLVEGRPAGGTGDGVLLARPATTGLAGSVWNRISLALLAGLLAGALAGALLARRLARPIRNAATAAARLSAGDRSVRVPPEPPTEVAELAHALNDLAAALATSEGRQREFLLSVSHELRTPLTTLKGYAEALADGVVGPDGLPRTGQIMLAEAEHLDRLIADLLALARLEAADFPVEPIPVDLSELLRAAAEAWAGRCAAAGVPLRTEIPDVAVVVHTDQVRIRQVVDGLLENALRIVPPGAPVVLAVRPGYQQGVVEVRDGGPGFTDGDLRVAFERGALHERYRGVRKVGSGLGLALAAGLVRRLGGAIEAGHAAEGGARFTVALPAPPVPRPEIPYQIRTSR